MTLADIQMFFAVLEYGSISKAAKKLFISQSTLSARIKALETELNAPLFYRGKGVRITEPTPFGRRFIPIAEKWEKLWQETLNNSLHTQHRQLNISAVHSINTYIIPNVYANFIVKNPEVYLRLITNRSSESAQLVESSEVDAAFISEPQFSRSSSITPLFKEKMFYVCRVPGKPGEAVHPSQLDVGQEIMLNWGGEYLQWHGYWFPTGGTPRVHTDDMDLVRLLLETENFWAIVPKSVAFSLARDQHVHVAPVSAPPPDRTIYLLTRSSSVFSDDFKAFIDQMRITITQQGSEWIYPLP